MRTLYEALRAKEHMECIVRQRWSSEVVVLDTLFASSQLWTCAERVRMLRNLVSRRDQDKAKGCMMKRRASRQWLRGLR